MTNPAPRADSLRITDLVPLRRMLCTDSIVIRVNADGTFVPVERMPTLFFDRPIRQLLADDVHAHFEAACTKAIVERTAIAFRPPGIDSSDEVLINPVLDSEGTDCRFLVCWSRRTDVRPGGSTRLAWEDLDLDDVVVRYRQLVDTDTTVIEAAPWWALEGGEPLELWPHDTHVSAMGLGHAVMELLIYDAAEAAAEQGGGPAVRFSIPSADMLVGLVPVFHGAMKASGLAPERAIVAIPVELAVDPDLLPIIVHLRTMGLQIDIVGLDALTLVLHMVSDTSDLSPTVPAASVTEVGEWHDHVPVPARF